MLQTLFVLLNWSIIERQLSLSSLPMCIRNNWSPSKKSFINLPLPYNPAFWFARFSGISGWGTLESKGFPRQSGQVSFSLSTLPHNQTQKNDGKVTWCASEHHDPTLSCRWWDTVLVLSSKRLGINGKSEPPQSSEFQQVEHLPKAGFSDTSRILLRVRLSCRWVSTSRRSSARL